MFLMATMYDDNKRNHFSDASVSHILYLSPLFKSNLKFLFFC